MTQWRIDEPESFQFQGVRRLQVRIVDGGVDVIGRPSVGDDHDAQVEVSELDDPVIITQEGDTLTITHERSMPGDLFDWVGLRPARAVVSVSVHPSCAVEVGVVSADAVVAGIEGPTKVKSVSGNVTLDGVRADVEARTVSGDLDSRGLAGSLRFTTVSGDLTVIDGSSKSVRAQTVSGQVMLDLDVATEAQVDLTSISGNLTLRLPETASLQVDLKTMSGELESAFEGVTMRRKPGRATLSGQVGGGAGALKAKTVSGDVTLLRRLSA